MRIRTRITSLFIFLFIAGIGSNAQDLHFSQFYNSPMNHNPALAGAFEGDTRFIGNYRNQWQSVPVPYLTFSGAYDTKIFNDIAPNGYFAAGLIFNHDKQGDSELRYTQIALSGSYTQYLSDYNFLTAGFQIGSVTRGFSLDGLTFENQYNGDVFDPGLDPRENFDNTSRSFLDMGAGLNFHTRNDDGFHLNIGTAIFHLTNPEQNFYNQTVSELPFRITGHLNGEAKLNEVLDIRFRILSQFQGPYQEFLTGSALEYNISRIRGKEIAVNLGTNYRYASGSDAVIPTLGVRYLMWYAEFSYDINVSPFDVATGGAGGPEIAVIYTITKVKPPKTFKSCPIF